MGKYNEELAKAGVLLAGEGLQPSSKGARVRFSGGARTVVDGPFPDTHGLIAGFWIFETASREEAIEWVKRCPNPLAGEAEIEIRQVYEAEDFGAEFTPELREAEARLRAQMVERPGRHHPQAAAARCRGDVVNGRSPALLVPAGEDRLGERHGLGVSTIDFKAIAPDGGLLVLENTFHADGGSAPAPASRAGRVVLRSRGRVRHRGRRRAAHPAARRLRARAAPCAARVGARR